MSRSRTKRPRDAARLATRHAAAASAITAPAVESPAAEPPAVAPAVESPAMRRLKNAGLHSPHTHCPLICTKSEGGSTRPH